MHDVADLTIDLVYGVKRTGLEELFRVYLRLMGSEQPVAIQSV